MAVEGAPCVECGTMMLPGSSIANAELCERCLLAPEWTGRRQREFRSKLISGAWFTPSIDERAAAKRPPEFGTAATVWSLEPEYYANLRSQSIALALREARAQTRGYVLLSANHNARLILAFNEVYGVCEYQNDETGDFLYAYTSQNLQEQVAAARHLEQECGDDGLGQVWYPSRFHMPRRTAFQVLSHAVYQDPTDPPKRLEWLETGDFSYTMRGIG